MHNDFAAKFDVAYNHRLYLRTKGHLDHDRIYWGERQDPTALEDENIEADQPGIGEQEEF